MKSINRIGIDVDEVLTPYLSELLFWYNQKHQTNFKPEEFASYRFWETWGGDRASATAEVMDFAKSSAFSNLSTLKDAQKVVGDLAKKYELFVVTSRQHVIKDATLDWLDRNFGGCFFDHVFTNHYSGGGVETSKTEQCQSLGIDLIIDDSIDLALECQQIDLRNILFGNYAWNQSSILSLNRLESWQDVAKLLL